MVSLLVIKSITLNISIGVVVTTAMKMPKIRIFQLICAINMEVVNIDNPINDMIALLNLESVVSETALDILIPKYVLNVINTAIIAL